MTRSISVVCLIFALLLAGCGAEPVSIDISGEFNMTERGFRLDGEISEAGTTGGKDVYRDVVVCLIDENGQILNRTQPQNMRLSQGEKNVTVSSDRVPKYVIIHSPDFWDVPDVSVTYYTRISDGEGFRSHVVQNAEELPVDTCN